MSSYPPTPAFGGYNFVPPKVPPPVQGSTATVVPTLSSDTTARRPTIPSQQSPTGPTTTLRKSPAKMDVQHIDAASDSLEEGELSEPHSANRDSVSSSSPILSGDEGRWSAYEPLDVALLVFSITGCSLFCDTI
ncbi:hypothetical protein K440DRAFT_626710 [Wilcoxina mikolae CBS 423.85]|nr:hypothetical protein K440DRAFT_626710 [Wilcoxina mikolae CBS 423.85]